MSTKITSIYDALIARLAALFPSHARLPNPYRLDQNNSMFLKQGYGVALNGGTNTNRVLNCQLSVERSVTIVLARQFFAREMDVASKAVTEKLLFEDQLILIKDLEFDPTMGQYVAKSAFVSDTGIQFVSNDAEKEDFMAVSSTFNFEYFETLT